MRVHLNCLHVKSLFVTASCAFVTIFCSMPYGLVTAEQLRIVTVQSTLRYTAGQLLRALPVGRMPSTDASSRPSVVFKLGLTNFMYLACFDC